MAVQRFRVLFRKGERVRYISHLDVLRFWERAIRRAELPLSYSQGFTPHPKLAFASPLPLGFMSEAEVMDVTLDERIDPEVFRSRLLPETTDDLSVIGISEIALSTLAPQAAILWADYRVDLVEADPDSVRSAVEGFLSCLEFPWTEEKKERTKTYNLRLAVALLDAAPLDGGMRLNMRLQADATITARPEQVLQAILPGVAPFAITRTGLLLDDPSPAREAWRRLGQYQS
ncbi:MAG: TIGR03936 family radical SAM-associated protein [Anaerolineaceae bacterium]